MTPSGPRADVCVTGGLGFIGTHLCRALAARGARVRCIDRLGPDAPGTPGMSGVFAAAEARSVLGGLPGISFIQADVGTDSLDLALDGADAVIHLAGLPGVRAGYPFSDLWRENTLNTVRLVREAARRGQRFVLASTSSVYGEASQLPTAEDARPAPLNPYAVSKLAAEQACLTAVAQEDADAVIARLFTVFGERQRPDMAFARWIEAILCGRPIPWYAREGSARDFTYVGDAIAGLIAVFEHGRSGQIYNIPGAGSAPLHSALTLLSEMLGRPARVDRSQSFSGEATVTSGCGRKAAAELGYRTRHSLAEGLERQVTGVLAARGWGAPGSPRLVPACEIAPREDPGSLLADVPGARQEHRDARALRYFARAPR